MLLMRMSVDHSVSFPQRETLVGVSQNIIWNIAAKSSPLIHKVFRKHVLFLKQLTISYLSCCNAGDVSMTLLLVFSLRVWLKPLNTCTQKELSTET